MTKVKLIVLATVAIYLLTAPLASAQTAHTVVRVEDVKWIDHPVFKGAKTAILVGDPSGVTQIRPCRVTSKPAI